MQITTLVFFALLAFFTWRGYQKGFIGSITRILSWIVAYPATLIFTPQVAHLLMQHTVLTGVIVYFVAGAGIFLSVSFLVSLLITTCSQLVPNTPVTDTSSKIGGAGIGALIGALAGLVAVYILGLVLTPKIPMHNDSSLVTQQSREVSNGQSGHSTAAANTSTVAVPALRDLQRANDSFIESSAKKLMGTAAAMAVDLALEDKTSSQVTKAFVQDPQTMLSHVQHMKNSGQIQALIADENIQSILTTGDTQALTRHPEFNALIHNPSMQALMAQSDVDSDAGAQAAAEKMVLAWNRVQMIKHDPRVIAIINDPEFQQQLNSANKLPLMMNPKLNQLTQIIFSQETVAANGMGNYNLVDEHKIHPSDETIDDKTSSSIYRWTDENGQVHFSDKPKSTQDNP